MGHKTKSEVWYWVILDELGHSESGQEKKGGLDMCIGRDFDLHHFLVSVHCVPICANCALISSILLTGLSLY